VTSSGRLFQTLAPAIGKARLPTVGRQKDGTSVPLTSLLPVRLQAPAVSLMSMLSYKESLAFQRRLAAFSRYFTLSKSKIAVKPLPAPLVTTHFDFSHTVSNYSALHVISSQFLQLYKHFQFSNSTSGPTPKTENQK